MTSKQPHTTRTLSAITVLVVLLAALAAALSVPGTAAAKGTKCGKEIVADWFDNGRIDRLYPLHCYEEAIDAIPQDIKDYANAADVIQHAMQRALTGHLYRCKGCPDPSPEGAARNPEGGDSNDGAQAAGPTPNASGPSSVPIPLLVLGGISLALLAAGGLGYYSRRRQAEAEDGGSDDDLSS